MNPFIVKDVIVIWGFCSSDFNFCYCNLVSISIGLELL